MSFEQNLELKIVSFKPGMELTVKGVPKPNATRFAINVRDSKQNIALHFNPRFDHLGGKRVLVLDSCKDGHWQNPLTLRNFPFHYGQEFEVTIIFADGKFYIKLQGDDMLEFPNRLADKQYDYITIDGEVTINGIYVK